MTYSKQLPDVRDILAKHKNVLYRSERMMEVFKDQPLVAFRRDRNLCDTLVHGKTNRAITTSMPKCPCKVCSIIQEGNISDVSRKETFRTVTNMSCTDRNLVYGLMCARCDKTIYVGETERTLKERITEHLRDVRLQTEKPVNRHFKDHSENDLRVTILQRVFHEGRVYRQLIEDLWIRKLGTKVPFGCNVKFY